MAAVVDKRRDSLSQVAYDQIKTMILQKDLTPGQFINEAQLQALLGLTYSRPERFLPWLRTSWFIYIPAKGLKSAAPRSRTSMISLKFAPCWNL